jgi:hypothetical protein
MSKLSIEAIKDFQMCERLFDYRYKQEVPEKIYARDIHTEKFESTIKSIMYFFFFKKQGGIIPSYASLLNRWEKMWFPKNTNSYDIVTEQHETAYGNTASLTSKAAGILLAFHETYAESSYIPVAISEEYNLPKNKLNIEDTFDIIFYNNKQYLVTKFIFNYKFSNRDLYRTDFCTMYQAYKNRHPERMGNVKFGFIDPLSQSLAFNEFQIRSEDIDYYNYWCDKIEKTEVYIPKRGLIPYCKKCPFDEPCSNWSEWKKEGSVK